VSYGVQGNYAFGASEAKKQETKLIVFSFWVTFLFFSKKRKRLLAGLDSEIKKRYFIL